MENARASCPACGKAVGEVWSVTHPRVFVICGDGPCERWAAANGLWIWTTSAQWRRGAPARPTRGGRTCGHCHKPLPRLRKDRFRVGRLEFCTLTCAQAHSRRR